MIEPPHIRPAHTGDIDMLAALAARTFQDAFARDNAPDDIQSYIRESFSTERLCIELTNPSNLFLLAHLAEADPPLGYAKLRTGTSEAGVKGPNPVELHRIYVDKSAIGSGVGAALMQASLDAARRSGHKTLWLGVWERNERAISFYRRWGFEVVGRHVFRLGSDDQTDLIMERAVNGAAEARQVPESR
jgi:ribosomal protein S18 acetylase RimI-like enzyme